MLEGAAILVMGVVLGVPVGALLTRRRKPPPPVKPMCSCGHSRGSHRSGGTGHCNVATVHLYGGKQVGKELACPCLTYDGPIPLPEYYAPEILP